MPQDRLELSTVWILSSLPLHWATTANVRVVITFIGCLTRVVALPPYNLVMALQLLSLATKTITHNTRWVFSPYIKTHVLSLPHLKKGAYPKTSYSPTNAVITLVLLCLERIIRFLSYLVPVVNYKAMVGITGFEPAKLLNPKLSVLPNWTISQYKINL